MSDKILDFDITNKLHQLKLDELKQLKARVDRLIQVHPETKLNGSTVDDITYIKGLLLKAISKHMSIIPLSQIQSSDKKLNTTLTQITKQIKKIYDNQSLAREDLSVLCQVITLASISKTNHMNIPLYFSTVIYNMQDIEILIDEFFPGYLKNNLLKLILQQKVKHNGI
jgi:hypothetical protein